VSCKLFNTVLLKLLLTLSPYSNKIKNVKFKIIGITTGCQYGGYFYYNKNLMDRIKPSTGPRVGHSWPSSCKSSVTKATSI